MQGTSFLMSCVKTDVSLTQVPTWISLIVCLSLLEWAAMLKSHGYWLLVLLILRQFVEIQFRAVQNETFTP
jgi:hypothetical protein